MNGLASVAFGIATVVGTVTVAASMASIGMAEKTEQDLRGLRDADLWTTEPTRVDPALQTYERLPPALSTYAMADDRSNAAKRPAAAERVVANIPPPSVKRSAEHLNWCASHYRSFDPRTNTYRSFRGQVRVCQPPSEKSTDTVASTTSAADAPLANAGIWCANRYKSYRAEDNTYQPSDGPRMRCTPPAEAQTVAANE
jgi:hypothetical protein